MSPYTNWLSKVSESDVVIAPLSSDGVVTVDMGGYVRLWETGLDTLQRSLMEWRNMIGEEEGRPVQVISFSSFHFCLDSVFGYLRFGSQFFGWTGE